MSRSSPPRFGSVKAIAGFVALLWVMAASSVSLAGLRVALVQTNPDQSSDVVALVETNLTTAGKVKLVERQQLEKVLHEQQLQTMLGADAVAGRVSLGKLLQADLLVFIQPQEKPQPNFKVVISETHQGLRLIRQAIPLKDAKSMAEAVQQLIDVAVDKQSHEIKAIFAVPPLVSNDLGFEMDHLKGAYAKLLEEVLAESKGVLVVELDEARALAKEITIGGGADVQRPLPFYVLGEYQTAGPANARTVKISLKLKQGDKQITGGAKDGLTLAKVPAFLREVALWYLSKSAVGTQAPADPKIEAAQLAEQARRQMSLGSWPEALDLLEACLLVDPHQPDIHLDAVEVLTNYTLDFDKEGEPKAPLANRPQGAARVAYYRRGLDHLETHFRETKIDRSNPRMATLIPLFSTSLDSWAYQMVYDKFMSGTVSREAGKMKPATLELLRVKYMNGSIAPAWPDYFSAREASTEMFYRVLAAKARDKVADDTLWFVGWFDEWDVKMPLPEGDVSYVGIDPDKWLAKRRELAQEFSYLTPQSKSGDLLQHSAHMFIGVWPPKDSQSQPTAAKRPTPPATIEPATSFGGLVQSMHAAAETASAKPVGAQAPAAPLSPSSPIPRAPVAAAAPLPAGPNDIVTFTALPLRDDGAADDSRPPTPPAGWIPAGKGTDFLWSRDGVYVMKDRGVMHWLDDRTPQRRAAIPPLPVFDGRYVWFTRKAEYDPAVSLLVVDLQKETVETVVTELPACSELEVTALGPGRAFVVGYFGRTVAATIEMNTAGKPKVKIVHQFRAMGQAGELDWHDTDLVFKPKRLFTLSEAAPGASAKQAVLVWRENHGNAGVYKAVIEEHPLIIDVEGGGIHPLDKPSAMITSLAIFGHDGVCDMILRDYANLRDYGNQPLVLRRFGVSAVTDRPANLALKPPSRLVFFHGSLLYVDHSGWSIADGVEGPFRSLQAAPPAEDLAETSANLAVSEHYGLVWVAKDGVYQVQLKGQ